MASIGSKVYVVGGESFAPSRGDDPNVIHILDTSQYIPQSSLLVLNMEIEHIKYPEDNRPPVNAAVPPANQNTLRRPSVTNQAQQQQALQQVQQQAQATVAPTSSTSATVNGRVMSPGVIPERTISPVGRPSNGVGGQQAFGSAAAAAAGVTNGRPVRPRREDEVVDEEESSTAESFQRARSPAQGITTRALSPVGSIGGAVGTTPAPAGGVQNMLAMAAAGGGPTGRQSPTVGSGSLSGRLSPLVTGRASPIATADNKRANGDVPAQQSSGQGVSPTLNGFRPSSRTGHHAQQYHQHGGSVGNVAGDLVRDLKAKDVELDSVKRQMAWMKETLGKAAKAGFVMSAEGEGGGMNGLGALEEEADAKQAEMALRFKQLRAQMQVGCWSCLRPM